MMILTAVILLAAFIALTAMVARVGDIAGETAREREDPFATEFEGVERGLVRAATGLASDPSAFGNDTARFMGEGVNASIEAMQRIEASRGYWMTASASCDGGLVGFTVSLRSAEAYARKQFISGVACVFDD